MQINEFRKRFEELKRNAPRMVAVTAVNFFKERFVAQNWLDKQAEPWKERKYIAGRKSDNRAVLTKSGRLRRSIRATSATFDKIVVASLDVPYAQTHNDGLNGEVNQIIKAHTRKGHLRKEHTRKGKEVPAHYIQEHTVKTHTRKLKMKVPQRRFMGASHTLNNQITDILKSQFEKVFK